MAHWVKQLRRKFGMTPADYERMLEAQKHLCAICRQQQRPSHIRLAVDHDHDTGQVRGLLCTPCNRWLGYVEKHPPMVLHLLMYFQSASRKKEV